MSSGQQPPEPVTGETGGDAAAAGIPPAGWYVTPDGQTRWWGGRAWAPVPPAPGTGQVWGVLSAASPLVMPLLPALALRLTVGREDPWARHHSTEALNGQLWLVVLWNGFLAPVFLSSGTLHPWVLWCFLGAFVSMASIYLMAIMHTVQAARGRWWRYPLPFRVVPGSVRRSD